MKQENRIESDFLGERRIGSDVYYGIQTLRAIENFHITNISISIEPRMVRALGYVKKAAALTNMALGELEARIGNAIVSACDEVIEGKLDDHFIVDALQGGAGTSTNMNTNEVIANKALEILGYDKGRYDVIHPNDHVNFAQSTNDVYPTAIRIALLLIIPELMNAMRSLSQAFTEKAQLFRNILKMGRTQLQDAVPMTLGQEFQAFATTISEDIDRLANARGLFHEINLGATAIGSGINSPHEYRHVVVNQLREITGLPLESSPDLFEATWDTGAYVQLSGVLKRVAIKLSKICNDLRLLSSGPRTGFGEINLPKIQPGSSIMPGKVNPVIPEVVNQIAFQVIGMDVTVTLASEAGQLQLNAMEPVMIFDLFFMLSILTRGCQTLEEKCVRGITANEERCRNLVLNSIGIVTVLTPVIGYESAAAIARQASETGLSVQEIAMESGLIKKEKLEELFSIENLVTPRFMRR